MTDNLAALRPKYGDTIGAVKGTGVVFTQQFEKFIDALIRSNSNAQEEPGAVFIPSIGQIMAFIHQEIETAQAEIRTGPVIKDLRRELAKMHAQLQTEQIKTRALEAKLNRFIAEVQTNG